MSKADKLLKVRRFKPQKSNFRKHAFSDDDDNSVSSPYLESKKVSDKLRDHPTESKSTLNDPFIKESIKLLVFSHQSDCSESNEPKGSKSAILSPVVGKFSIISDPS